MIVIGLTGGIGSGKTTVLKMFQQFNVSVYIADNEAKKLMQSSPIIKKKLITNFGKMVYENGKLNRSFLASIVFKDPAKLAVLNAIVHPEVKKHFKAFVASQKTDFVLYENAILFESNAAQFCQYIITVTASVNERIFRVIRRDKVNKEQVINRMKNQFTDTKKIANSHFVIINHDLKSTKDQVELVAQKIGIDLKKC